MRYSLILSFILISVLACQSCTDSGKQGQPAATGNPTDLGSHITATAYSAPESQSTGKFTFLTADQSGIDFVNKADSRAALLSDIYTQAGIASADYDNDGDIDFYILGIENGNALYRNDGGFRFTDVTAESGDGISVEGVVSSGAIFFDVDGDGDQDLWVAVRANGNKLFMNDGSGKFTEEGVARNAVLGKSTISAAIFDVENDGDLDMYICNNRDFRAPDFMTAEQREGFEVMDGPDGRPVLTPEYEKIYYLDEIGKPHMRPEYDYLLINDGTGHFTDNTEAAGVRDVTESLQALACDYNEDGFTDLFVSGDFETPDRYYINNGDGTFTDHSRDMLRRTSFYSMGSDAGDLNGDGLMDVWVGDMAPNGYVESKKASGDMYLFRDYLIYYQPHQMMQNSMYLNRGGGWMSEIAEYTGTKATEWTWSCRINDFNNDGIPELFATNGYIQSISADWDMLSEMDRMSRSGASQDEIDNWILQHPKLEKVDVMFTAEEPLKYKRTSDEWGITDETIGVGAVIQDFDNDGDLDIIVNNTGEAPAVMRNDLTLKGSNVSFDLRQDGKNPQAVGAKLHAWCGDKEYTQHVILCRGYGSGESSRAYMSIGEAKQVDKLEIIWPDGQVQTEMNLAGGMHYVINRHNATAPEADNSQPMFERESLNYLRSEVYTGDKEYQLEPLLPLLRSTLGGGAAMADFNLDGNTDVYFAGSTQSPGALFNGRDDGNFVSSPAFNDLMPVGSEAMAVLAFEANGDGRTDLLITSGGNETSDPNLLQDRLFLNLESGMQEIKLPGTSFSSGAAAAADIDGDNDLDLLICARQVPFSFLSSAPALILANDGSGNFSDATAQWTAGRGMSGRFSDAQFCDIDGDGMQDIITCEDFGNISVMRNTGEAFAEPVAISPSGMWASFTIADMDNDGDPDIIGGNWGKNNKYKATTEAPMTIAAQDFDNNGTRDIVEVKFGGDGTALPGRGRSCSGYAINTIPQKFPTWDEFAHANFTDIYGPLENVKERFEAEELYTSIFWNDGGLHFRSEHLPNMAQLSPVFGIVAEDFDGDGQLDLFLNDNFYACQPETSRWINGYGTVVLRNADGSFRTIEPHESGIFSYGEGRGALPITRRDGHGSILISGTNGKPAVANTVFAHGFQLVSVKGPVTNPAGVGSRVELELANGGKLTEWIQAGQGYLSSAVQPVSFSIPDGDSVKSLRIVWADGTSQDLDTSQASVEAVYGGA
ncbi:VCBS repeat-containing protein [bacterium]|nr:VCBS repeat-containing protein [bacterium]UNM07704.1 MAG: VCBS repeat-containing protein [Planctomycetales bacterium]